MISLSPIRNLEYYDLLAEEDYYTNGGEPLGVWCGKGAVLLGLTGQVNSNDYHSIMRGYSAEGEMLCQNAGDSHRAGYDFCFSPPKSVSVLWARAGEKLKKEIQNAQLESVRAAIRHLESNAAIARRGHNGSKREKAVGLVVPTFEHSTSRALDPQLHTHALIANVVPRSDGSWGTLESKELFFWQCSAASIYRAELAYRLQQLGFEVEPYQDTFQVVGVPMSLHERFSKRSKDIRRRLSEAGVHSGKSKIGDIIALDSRTKKQQVDRSLLVDGWQKEMDQLGFYSNSLDQIRSPFPVVKNGILFDEVMILEFLSERVSVFRKQHIYRVAGNLAQLSGVNANRVEMVVDRLLSHPELRFLNYDSKSNELYTTATILDAEYRLIDYAKKLLRFNPYRLDKEQTEYAIRTMQQLGCEYSEEQLEAIFSVCSSNGFSIMQGSAGAGKTASLNAIRMAYENCGYTVIGAATSKIAADNLGYEANVESFTVAKLLVDIVKARSVLSANTVLLIDEAGQLSSIDLCAIMKAAFERGVKIVLVGEDKQLDAISHGGALRYLSRPEVIGTSRIETVRRQREDWAKRAVMDLRDGNSYSALKAHDDKGLIHIGADSYMTRSLLVERWHRYRLEHPRKKSMILAYNWKDVRAISEEVRAILQAENQLSSENITLKCNVSDKEMQFEFSTGERVRLTRNDYKRGFTNGMLGTVTSVKQAKNGNVRFAVESDDGKSLKFSSQNYCDEYGRLFLAHAYATTVYSSQGITVDGDTFVLFNCGMDRAACYVAGSRHKDNCHWFINQSSIQEYSASGRGLDRRQLIISVAEIMRQDRYKCLASEYLDIPLKPNEPHLAENELLTVFR
ncbi:relaxase domain-containing protein [Vibrio fluvialis]|nr:relaxase domain-containing protein [Vibrio fluvialis]